jgi:hypothetical protein
MVHKPYRAKEGFTTMARHLGVDYRQPEAVPKVSVESPPMLHAEAIAGLPIELRIELTDAVIALNMNQIDAAIQRISALEAELGAALAFHAGRFALTQILEALKECENLKS